jgi:hypothetical protein
MLTNPLGLLVLSDYSDGITDDLGMIGQTAMEMDNTNQKPIQLGRPALDAALYEEIEQALRQADTTIKPVVAATTTNTTTTDKEVNNCCLAQRA